MFRHLDENRCPILVPLFTAVKVALIFCTVYVCLALLPTDETAIKCIISILCFFICTHI